MDYIIDNNQKYTLEHFNAVGLLFKDRVYLNHNDELLPFEISDIKSIRFRKTRTLRNNYPLLVISCIIALATYYLGNDFRSEVLPGFLVSGVIMGYALLKKFYQYKVSLITFGHHFYNIKVNAASKEQALELVGMTKRKMKNSKVYLKAS